MNNCITNYETAIVEAIQASIQNHEWCCKGKIEKEVLYIKLSILSGFLF